MHHRNPLSRTAKAESTDAEKAPSTDQEVASKLSDSDENAVSNDSERADGSSTVPVADDSTDTAGLMWQALFGVESSEIAPAFAEPR